MVCSSQTPPEPDRGDRAKAERLLAQAFAMLNNIRDLQLFYTLDEVPPKSDEIHQVLSDSYSDAQRIYTAMERVFALVQSGSGSKN